MPLRLPQRGADHAGSGLHAGLRGHRVHHRANARLGRASVACPRTSSAVSTFRGSNRGTPCRRRKVHEQARAHEQHAGERHSAATTAPSTRWPRPPARPRPLVDEGGPASLAAPAPGIRLEDEPRQDVARSAKAERPVHRDRGRGGATKRARPRPANASTTPTLPPSAASVMPPSPSGRVRPARAHRQPQRELARREGAREQEAGQVDACDQHHEADGGQQDEAPAGPLRP